ncbi:crossover junction endodeoxyribonuclease RuvC [Tuwongella immobilis]|uniref:Crossover junction endodeoxyribonuclease RuvC n=1 Tax=Tuwongella immobilis TaxID=692036 RepID=A0A6C2YUR9_9BACT|nr:crossover junction endodeoxyribonuclease RuvC [Tuwongella immobilis]VIP04903.1 crossover junction endodeoxyribonuclease : Crossover junction endodeoxyribonuclease RuvC OS=Pirellula staleyi (strain ATCC 27377 / DSM 6068 / ICPB 4128) GN=ruvC PE=3 SV=1: RuvC [Tuwongella immobilis]VTS07165.1 crossover junction endodeoxyribonuclease : Crossover junction endodeoxyribonuclease RuvC OS=Pirellula staleyi (strain ATCC 27377 / DSM 6068 / ICPB 4128) GN=ruvC PE=3 SV=1: RuvC [Tuwongella immobilis]
MATTPRRIMGIDPGLNTTGYGVIEIVDRTVRILEAGVVRSTPKRAATDMADRLCTLYNGIVEVMDQWKPSVVSVEQLYAHYEHPRTAILMGHARGVFLLAAAQRSVVVVSYNATQIKKSITGAGHANKEQMQRAMMRELRLQAMPEPHDVADALAAALCHYYTESTAGQTIDLNEVG